jgi:CheY-like chemotaxis protein
MGNGKILIAENSRRDMEELTRILVNDGYEVLQAFDGAETVSAARCHQPNIILLNTNFPPDVSHGGGALTDGFLIIQWLKRMEELAGVRIILMTDENAEPLQARARAAGAVGLFQKPINQEALLGTLGRLLGGVAPQPAAEEAPQN